MAYHWTDNVYTAAFTPREYQVELIDAARDRNIIVCLGKTLSRDFIALKIIQEHARHIRRSFDDGGKRSIYLVHESRVRAISGLLEFLTDLKISSHLEITDDMDWDVEFQEKEVFVMTSQICLDLVLCNYIQLERINVLIIDDCHQAVDLNHPIAQLMEQCSFTFTQESPRIVGLTGPLYTTGCYGGVLAATLKSLENTLKCEVETASDVVSVLRYTTKPAELLVECAEPFRDSLDKSIRIMISDIKYWLEDHRFAQHEYYPAEYFDELKAIPDPSIEPLRLIDDFVCVLDELGPWGANRAAIALLSQIDKLKVKTAFERHFLLLQMLFSSLAIIHQKCELEFENCSSEMNKVLNYSTPKVLRLLELVKMYQPDENANAPEINSSQHMNGNELCKDIGETSSKSKYLENKIETKKDCDHTYSANDKIKTENIKENCQNMSTSEQKSDFKKDVFKETKENVINDSMAKNKSPQLMEQLREIEACNFKLLKENIEQTYNNISTEELSETHIIKEMKKLVVSEVIENFIFKSTNDSKESSDSGIEAMSSPKRNIVSGPNRNTPTRGDSGYRRGAGRHRRGGPGGARGPRFPHGLYHTLDPDALCGIIFVKKPFIAKILYGLLYDLSKADESYSFLNAQYTVQKTVDPLKESREAEIEHRKQEEVLKRFRMHECNLLIGTSILEQGIDLPRCNLIVHWDEPPAFCNYAHCKGRARAPGALYVNLVTPENSQRAVTKLAEYMEIEKMLLSKCRNTEPPEFEEKHADLFTNCIKPYCPTNIPGSASVNLSTAVALVNKYCAKLPSDTFTRLTPLWRIYKLNRNGTELYQCVLRLPINSPTKHDVIGIPMPTRVLARRIVAFQTCVMLHKSGELDDNLQPIGKEGFKVQEEWEISDVEEDICRDDLEPRPGTTKRRQYYYKKMAYSLSNCRPSSGKSCYFYQIYMCLTCPLPEEQNTRGRQLYAPEDSPHGFGILTVKPIPKVGSFPIFTRSGEVSVSLRMIDDQVVVTNDQIKKIYTFINYTFTSVLRLQKHFMMFGPELSDNCFFIVPTVTDLSGQVYVDWVFLDTIEMTDKTLSEPVANEVCKDRQFHPELYNDAVVMPWYRNQDTPQFFYVAKICTDLNPLSPFPGEQFNCFEDYYAKKYRIKVKNIGQPLLDVDHTSGRLNFLTPRYVNRKGVALPTSSEETKRAKREDLGNKQILIPELCIVHPFPGALWRAAVCLPCILYRINGLLVADQIRRTVALEIGLGTRELVTETDWPRLDFGWSLAEIFQKVYEKRAQIGNESQSDLTDSHDNTVECIKTEMEIEENIDNICEDENRKDQSTTDDEEEIDGEKKDKNDLLEIGTWSNEMADFSELPTEYQALRYGSPTFGAIYSDSDTDSYMSSDSEEESEGSQKGGLRIEFKGDNLAEAVETDADEVKTSLYKTTNNKLDLSWKAVEISSEDTYAMAYKESINNLEIHICTSGILVKSGEQIPIRKKISKTNTKQVTIESNPIQELLPYHEKLNRSIISIEDIEAINSSYITANGVDATNLVHIADFYEGINNVDNTPTIKSEMKSFETEIEIDNNDNKFSFDYQPALQCHPGPSPSIILQALTMSNANDGINLERLETIGDSFLKYAITTYLYCTYDNIHEGKLSHLRSMQVSNLHLYRLGRRKNLGENMIATKFEPHDNWLPPCFYVPRDLEDALLAANFPPHCWDMNDLPSMQSLPREELMRVIKQRAIQLGFLTDNDNNEVVPVHQLDNDNVPCHIPYNLITQHSIPDKSIADCVEALIGAYLIECGPRGALLFMSWLGIRVLPVHEVISETKPKEFEDEDENNKITGFTTPVFKNGVWVQNCFGTLQIPRSPLLRNIVGPEECLEVLLDGYETFEDILGYRFIDRAYLLQAMTHASYAQNRLTDCYQRLEFLGDAVLDYLITRNLYDSPLKHSPGALTDLRSALVNNTIFASLAVRHNFHKYFRHMSPPLQEMIDRFVQIQEANNHTISEEYYLLGEDECAEVEDIEVPKALGDVFESVAGAIYLDSNMSLDTVWKVYYAMMKKELIQFSNSVPKSPIRELLEMEPETAKFGKPEKLADGRRVRVTVEVFGKGSFKGIGRNYRIAKCTAAKCALKKLKANKKQR